MTCNDCPRLDKCAELCAEAEGYVNQDHVGRQNPKEIPVPDAPEGRLPGHLRGIHLTVRERQVVTLLGSGLTPAQVREQLEITTTNYTSIINRVAQKWRDCDVSLV